MIESFWVPDGIFLSDVYHTLARELLHDDPDTVGLIVSNLMQYGDPEGQYYPLYSTPSRSTWTMSW